MTEDDMSKTAQLAMATSEVMERNLLPLAAGAHLGVMVLIDMAREDPEFEARFQAALKRRLAFYPPIFDQAASVFATPEQAGDIEAPCQH